MSIEPSAEALFSAAVARGRTGTPSLHEVQHAARAAERARRRALLSA